ncbi:MAG: hypothetical protein HKN10_11105 [Myxococcales bacterium]|nr:hypothetical protein [Deltaproteobacteria bacterium]NNE19013.1 hypothetical protein [Myxococcales bacterium]
MIAGAKPVVQEYGLIFEESAWPLAYVRFPSKPLSDDGFEYFIERYTAMVERQRPFATILDSRGLTTAITAHQRKLLTDWFDVTGELAGEYHFGIAVLMSNALIRGALKAVTWVKPVPVPIMPFGSIADAAPWVREIFREQRIPITPEIELLLKGRS